MPPDKEEIIRKLLLEKEKLFKKFKLRSLAVFGSYSRGDQTSGSDIDILVEVDPSIGLKFVTLAQSLQELLGIKVDLVSSRAIKKKYFELIKDELIYV
jgi:uncharacterized protein